MTLKTLPTEELLRQIDEELKKQRRVSPALYQQLDIRLNQLLNRCTLLKQNAIRGR
ncbi:VasL domain-containing protein [Citrobacter braakii]|uniref:VasL domain-containing protein n=1 Tax=Citrobacter braakii TaxID=57706 RepID=UPI001F4893C5|nr:VasL domain-containing protein [Citrobacter braakii]